jgi:hypothetical protein
MYGTRAGLTSERSRQLDQGSGGGAPEAGDRFGFALAAANLDGYGQADLIAGAPDEDAYGLTDVGFANLLYGDWGSGLGGTRRKQLDQSNLGVCVAGFGGLNQRGNHNR